MGTTTTTTILRPFFWDHPGEPVTEENFWTLWCKGRITEADTPTIQLGTSPSGNGWIIYGKFNADFFLRNEG